jgi:hypothetical protein
VTVVWDGDAVVMSGVLVECIGSELSHFLPVRPWRHIEKWKRIVNVQRGFDPGGTGLVAGRKDVGCAEHF